MLVRQSIPAPDTGWGVKVNSAVIAIGTALPFAVIVMASYHLTGVQKLGEMMELFRKRT